MERDWERERERERKEYMFRYLKRIVPSFFDHCRTDIILDFFQTRKIKFSRAICYGRTDEHAICYLNVWIYRNHIFYIQVREFFSITTETSVVERKTLSFLWSDRLGVVAHVVHVALSVNTRVVERRIIIRVISSVRDNWTWHASAIVTMFETYSVYSHTSDVHGPPGVITSSRMMIIIIITATNKREREMRSKIPLFRSNPMA